MPHDWPHDPAVRLSRTILRGATRLVPFHRRRAWHAEWEAELWTLRSRKAKGSKLLRFALGGVAHALWERREEEGMIVDGITQDVRFALRRIAKTPGFALVTVSVLGLGIGANTALFGPLSQALLQAPPYPESDRIVLVDMLLESAAGEPADTMGWSYPKFEMSRSLLSSFSEISGYAPSTLTLSGDEQATRVTMEYVTPGYFDLLGIAPAAGRLFTSAEEAPAEAPIAVLSHAFWQERFGGDPAVVDRIVTLNGASIRLVGVAEPGFRGLTGNAELWVPVAGITAISGPRRLQLPWAHWLRAVGRLAPEAALDRARDEARRVGLALTEAYPDPDGGGAHGVALVPLGLARVNPVARASVTAVSAAALLFLLIACGSVAGLLLARAADRSTDVAVRAALGASRARLVREQLVESLLLAGAGGALGITLAAVGHEAVVRAVRHALDLSGTRGLRYLDPDGLTLEAGTLLAGLAVACLTGLVFGLLPAWVASKTEGGAGLRTGGAVGARTSGRERGRSLLVCGQLALTLVLLAGSGLMAASFGRLARVDPGFANHDVIAFSYDRGPGATDQEHHLFVSSVIERIEALPAVQGASVATCPPLAGRCEIVGLRQVDDEEPRDYSDMVGVLAYTATDGYFDTVGVPLLEGRTFDRSDADGPPVVVISESAARAQFPGVSAVGHRLSITHALTERELATVIGVVGDVRYAGLDVEAMPAVYLSERQVAMPYGTILVHAAPPTGEVVDAVREIAAALDPDLPLYGVTTLAERVAASTARTRILLALLAAFAASGLLIGGLGLYGIVAHAVAKRTAEVGLRIALGADRGGVLRLVVARPAGIALGATVVGGVAATLLSGYLTSLIFGSPGSPLSTLLPAAALLLAVAAVAAWIPARRATRIAPTEALRAE